MAIISRPPGVVRIRNANEYSADYYECTIGTFFLYNGIKTTVETETITQFTQHRGERNNAINTITNSPNILSVTCFKYIFIFIFFMNLYNIIK